MPTITDDETGAPRPVTDAELLNMGLVVLGTLPSGDLVVDAGVALGLDGRPCPAEACDLPGAVLSEGYAVRKGRGRYETLPEPARLKAWRRRVYRRTDGLSLRIRVAADLGISISPREDAPPDAVARARDLVADDAEPVTTLLVALDEVEAGDIVEPGESPAHRWLGER